jgi:hypothetical protein
MRPDAAAAGPESSIASPPWVRFRRGSSFGIRGCGGFHTSPTRRPRPHGPLRTCGRLAAGRAHGRGRPSLRQRSRSGRPRPEHLSRGRRVGRGTLPLGRPGRPGPRRSLCRHTPGVRYPGNDQQPEFCLLADNPHRHERGRGPEHRHGGGGRHPPPRRRASCHPVPGRGPPAPHPRATPSAC